MSLTLDFSWLASSLFWAGFAVGVAITVAIGFILWLEAMKA